MGRRQSRADGPSWIVKTSDRVWANVRPEPTEEAGRLSFTTSNGVPVIIDAQGALVTKCLPAGVWEHVTVLGERS